MPEPASAEPGSPRCFIALLPDAASRDGLRDCRDALIRALPGAARGVRWIDPAALHVTLRFFGAATLAQLEYLKHMLPALARALPGIAARRYAIWPNRARPRLLVLELDAPDVLLALAGECEALAHKCGFEADARGFKAHLTLARLRPGCAFGILPGPPATVGFDTVALMQSTLAQPAAIYRELARTAMQSASKP